jgi:hypothetical protein
MVRYRAMFGRLNDGSPSYEFPKFEADANDSDTELQELAEKALNARPNISLVTEWELITIERIQEDT